MRISQPPLLALLSLVPGAVSLCSAGPITYYLNQTIGAASVTGDIVTDGTIGVLTQADITGYNLLLSDPGVNVYTSAYNLSCCSFFPFAGSDLSATTSQLLFNFSGMDNGVVNFADPSLDFDLCFSTSGGVFGPSSFCEVAGTTLTFIESPPGFGFQSAPLSGTQAIAATEQTADLLNFQGGSTSTPVLLPGGSPVSQITGTIGGVGTEDYYSFYWGGGAFLATGAITGTPNAGASYLFSEGVAGSCSSGGTETLNSGDSYAGTIAIGNLTAGDYCIGVDANNSNDPGFLLTFDTPIQGVASPEPSTLVLLAIGLGIVGLLRRTRAAGKKFCTVTPTTFPDFFREAVPLSRRSRQCQFCGGELVALQVDPKYCVS